ncbi:hypothetical protein V496_01859 [Pseudogymnoascus sp. VKM F-4515 (FW-2607)]|nr:hypothetical protein V496_01859 [Pseudogymnoascus sp. VKM F-4515 (FW-2607)]
MPHPDGDSYLESQNLSQPIAEYRDAPIAVHASYYLQKFLDTPPSAEPLLSAIGGYPLAIRIHINADLDQWQKHGITPRFYFDGQATVGSEEVAMKDAKVSMEKSNAAWQPYYQNQPTEAVIAFGKTGSVKANHLQRYFQQILIERGLTFEVAPYSACAQMAYVDSKDLDCAVGIMGPSELLLYNINESLITEIDFEKGLVYGLVKTQLLKKLNVNEETFIDSYLMTGTSSLQPFPALNDPAVVPKQPYTILDAVNMYRTAGKSIATLCETWSEALQKQDPNWQDKYQKCRMAIKHAVVLSTNGTLEVMKFNELSGDHHEYIGLQLAAEIYHYQSKALVGPRVLNSLASLRMYVYPPLDGGESDEYRKLVTQQLVPIQEQTIALYASRLHRAFQHKNIEMKFWYDDKKTVKMTHQDVTPAPDRQAATWRVDDKTMKSLKDVKAKPGSIGFALKALDDENFRKASLKKDTPAKPSSIVSTESVVANTLWRFLHLRGYINDEHKLTEWGSALATTVHALPMPNQEEAALLAFELLRHDILNARNRHDEWIGGPNMGNDEQNKLCLLIARCACLLKLRHKEIGFTGPLSKNLLAHHSIITAVRECDRDLIEAVAASMFISSHAERKNRTDWEKIGASLLFGEDISIAFGITVKTYLDEQHQGHSSAELKAREKSRYEKWPIAHAEDILGDLDLAFKFFDALHAGIKTLGSKVEDQDVWESAAKYLAERQSPGCESVITRAFYFPLHQNNHISSCTNHKEFFKMMMFTKGFVLASLAAVAVAKSAVLDLVPDNFDKIVLSGKPALVEFFAPWCGHCKTLAPVYEELAQAFEFASDKVSVAKVDADAEKSLGKRFGIQGFPTLKWFDGKSKDPQDYSGGRDLESLTKFITDKTGIKPRKAKAPASDVVFLTDANFKEAIGGDKAVLVAFTAPWCGHCKTLAPIWEEVATDFAAESSVVVAKVDADSESSKLTAALEGVSSYPTIKFFPRGSTEGIAYSGGRSEKDILAYLNEKAGTHRTPGGGLDAQAGIIDAFDKVIKKLGGTTNVAEITAEATKIAQELQDTAEKKYAEYYVKVFAKLSESTEYAAKELARLQGLLSKGNLAKVKEDEMTAKSNILKTFEEKEKEKAHEEL